MPERLAYRPEEVAEALGLSRAYVYDLITRGELKACRLGRILLVEREEVEHFLAAHRVEAAEADPQMVQLLEEALA